MSVPTRVAEAGPGLPLVYVVVAECRAGRPDEAPTVQGRCQGLRTGQTDKLLACIATAFPLFLHLSTVPCGRRSNH